MEEEETEPEDEESSDLFGSGQEEMLEMVADGLMQYVYAEEQAERERQQRRDRNTDNRLGMPATVDGIFYRVSSKKMVAKAILCREEVPEHVVLPRTIRDCLLVEIGAGCFKESHLKSIVIPNTVTAIKPCCFSASIHLETVEFERGSQLEEIGEAAFGFSTLKSIVIPAGVEALNACVFQNSLISSLTFEEEPRLKRIEALALVCENLRVFVIPASVEHVSGAAIYSIAEIVLDPGNKNYVITDGLLIHKARATVARCFKKGSVVIPKMITTIGEGCFLMAQGITDISGESGCRIKYIERMAFMVLHNVEVRLDLMHLQSAKWDAFGPEEDNVTFVTENGEFLDWLRTQHYNRCNYESDDPQEEETETPGPRSAHLEDWVVNMKEYKFVRHIGDGGFSSVDLFKRARDAKAVAIKSIPCEGNKEANERAFLREVRCYIGLYHPCILSFIGYCLQRSDNDSMSILTEYMSEGSLKDVIEDEEKPDWYTPTSQAIIIAGIVIAMHHVHSRGFIHRDLKPGNVLLDRRHYVRIADFGSSRNQTNDATLTVGLLFTPSYAAPELFNQNQEYTDKIDVYSFGVILYEMVTGLRLFGKRTMLEIAGTLARRTRQRIPESVLPFTASLISRCWAHDPDDRPSFTDIANELVKQRFEIVRGVNDREVKDFLRWVKG